MPKGKRRNLSADVSEREEESRGILLTSVLTFMMAALSLAMAINILLLPSFILRGAAIILVVDSICGIMLFLLKRKRLGSRSASLILLVGIWIVLTALASTAGGLNAPAVFTLLAFVFVASLLLGKRSGYLFAAAVILSTGLMVVLGQTKILPAGFHNSLLTSFISFAFSVALIARVQALSATLAREGAVAAQREIEERKRSEERACRDLERRNALIGELCHRTGNNLQMLLALINLRRRGPNESLAGEDTDRLMDSIFILAYVQDRLSHDGDYSSIELGSCLRELSSSLALDYGPSARPVRLSVETDEARVVLDVAQPCALILSELISNSLRHALKTEGPLALSVSLKASGGEDLILTVSDDGEGPAFDPRASTGLGMRTVFGLGEIQLGGSITFPAGPGFSTRLAFSAAGFKARI